MLLRLLLSVATLLVGTTIMNWCVTLMFEWGKVPASGTLPRLHWMSVGEVLRQPVLLASASLLAGAAWAIWSKPFRLWRLWFAAAPILSFAAWPIPSTAHFLVLAAAVLLALLWGAARAILSNPYRHYALAFVATLLLYAVPLAPRTSLLVWLVATTFLVGLAWLIVWRTPYRRPFVTASLIGIVAWLLPSILPRS